MKTKNLLLIGSACWIGYMLYSKYQSTQQIKDLRNRVSKAEAMLNTTFSDMGKALTDAPQVKPQMTIDDMLMPGNIRKSYNTSANATVSRPSTEVFT